MLFVNDGLYIYVCPITIINYHYKKTIFNFLLVLSVVFLSSCNSDLTEDIYNKNEDSIVTNSFKKIDIEEIINESVDYYYNIYENYSMEEVSLDKYEEEIIIHEINPDYNIVEYNHNNLPFSIEGKEFLSNFLTEIYHSQGNEELENVILNYTYLLSEQEILYDEKEELELFIYSISEYWKEERYISTIQNIPSFNINEIELLYYNYGGGFWDCMKGIDTKKMADEALKSGMKGAAKGAIIGSLGGPKGAATGAANGFARGAASGAAKVVAVKAWDCYKGLEYSKNITLEDALEIDFLKLEHMEMINENQKAEILVNHHKLDFYDSNKVIIFN